MGIFQHGLLCICQDLLVNEKTALHYFSTPAILAGGKTLVYMGFSVPVKHESAFFKVM